LKKTKHKREQGIKDRIREVATRLFCLRGYGATAVSEIVSQAGVTKPVLYYYFGSKAGLFTHIFEHHFGMLRDLVSKAQRHPGSCKEKVLQLTADQFELSRQNFDGARLIISTVLGPEKGTPLVRFAELHRSLAELFCAILAEGIQRGEVRPMRVDEAGLAYIGMVNMFIMRQVSRRTWSLDRDSAARLVDLYFSGITGAGPATQSGPVPQGARGC
jgi:AcrR family transcriptional regulator